MLLGYHYLYFYHMAYAINQYFANKGYVVISVNYRAGIGYGREFRMAPPVARPAHRSTRTSTRRPSTCSRVPTWTPSGSGCGGSPMAG